MAWLKIKQKIWHLRGIATVAPSIAFLVILSSFTGIYQTLEWATYDFWVRIRAPEPKDSRIVIVNIEESDLRALGEWPISDGKLAQLLQIINKQQPRVIGLDLYRDLNHGDESGKQQLNEIYRSTPNLIAVEKAIGEKIDAPPILKAQGQTAMADLVLDQDGKVRRGLISATLDDGQTELALATKLSLIYLQQEGIELKSIEGSPGKILGKGVFLPIKSNEGAYINVDSRGYQLILNFRGDQERFNHVSITRVLNGDIPQDLFYDRIVLIGATAESLNDFFLTPYNDSSSGLTKIMPGVYVHANLTSQMISSALDGRRMIRGIKEVAEWGWILFWSLFGAGISLVILERNLLRIDSLFYLQLILISGLLPIGILFATSYTLFLLGWWLPTISPLIALIISTVAVFGYYNQNQKNLAFTDGLTNLANRRFFDHYLEEQWHKIKQDKDLALIICDVDFFKFYNDTYGHQAGDECLKQVAQAISSAIRSHDLAARYGGEEFVVVLPNTDPETALLAANRIRFKIKAMQIPHKKSQVSSYVSISLGIASVNYNKAHSPQELIALADKGLYLAKQQGRDRAMIVEP
ncbi:MAG: CHASE2 domain-containing protein [Xenococcaceae cyanobacterium MO_167.B52]|nr:CHASE2 domain-containing protein [Xenococcaceae cyanobacterium MO_167.B52]